jgi:hypothetical protein
MLLLSNHDRRLTRTAKGRRKTGTMDDFKFASQLGETVTTDLRERPQPK